MMKRIARPLVLLPAVALAATCTAWAAQTGIDVAMGGNIISTDVQIVKGRPYVPLSDVAKALNLTLVKKGNRYTLTRGVGADRLPGYGGTMASSIFSGSWTLRVVSAETATAYGRQYGPDNGPVTPQETGDLLVVIKCRLKNSSKATQSVYFDTNSAGNTALTDDQEHAYSPLTYDTRNSGTDSDKMLPGSAHDFAVVFSVPKDTKFKDLIYSVATTELDKSTDFRVSLKP